MAENTIISIEKPQTQTVEAVKSLLTWRGWASDPLPSFIEMGEGEGRLVLVLSNRKDCYYIVTKEECSCPARSWHTNGPCKHMRRYFPEQQTIQKQSMAATLEQADANLSKMPYRYRQMVKAAREAAEAEPSDIIPHKPFKPFIEDELRPAAKVSSIPLVDTLGDPTNRDIAYHSIKEDRIMWPVEA